MIRRIGCDIDGVLADFESGYLKKLQAASGGKLLLAKGEEPPCWKWATAVGYTRQEDDRAWESIKGDALFWATLEPMPGAQKALHILAQLYQEGHEVYFITNRPGIAPHMQSVIWLINMGFPTPTVLISGEKGAIVRGLRLSHFLDDKPENLYDAHQEWPECSLFCMAHRYNEADHPKLEECGVKIVRSFKAFFEDLVKDEIIEQMSLEVEPLI